MKKRILSLVLCAAMLLSMCLFLGAGVTDEGETCKITVNYIYESDSSPVAQATVLQVAKDEPLTKEIAIPKQENYKPKLAEGMPSGIALDVDRGILKFENFMPTGNVTVKVLYVAGNAKYTVNHYLQNLNDDDYTPDKPVEMMGSIDAYTEAVANKYEGFTASEITQTPIAADNTTVVDIYYTRNYYMVHFDANGGVNGPEPIYAKYGATIGVPAAPTKAGYTFAGWVCQGQDLTADTTVTGSATYTAAWTPASNKASVTVVYWGQNANDNEYSFYGAVELPNQPVDQEINWDTVAYTVAYVCGKTAHTHSAACGLNCSHVHDATCYGTSGKSVNPDNDKEWWNGESSVAELAQKLNGGLKNGYVYGWEQNAEYASSKTYYLYLNEQFYKIGRTLPKYANANVEQSVSDDSGENPDYLKEYSVVESKIPCKHTHDDSCYACGLVAHTHSDGCKAELSKKMDSSLWTYEKSDTVTVDAAGNTIMNVYYTRTKVTLYFEGKGSYTITDRWGADIENRFKGINDEVAAKYTGREKLQGWHDSRSSESTTMTNYIGVMPKPEKNKITFTAVTGRGNKTAKWTYYREDLNGKDQFAFDVEVKYSGTLTVSSDDYYTFEGFECDKDRSTKEGKTIDGAKFYYKRKQYTLNFFNGDASKAETVKKLKFEESLSNSYYEPVNRPAGVERDAEFAGWYLNPQCTGEQYDLSEHTMPANDIALYAKWVNCSYTVTTYTDDTLNARYTYDGYNGVQSVVKYKKGVAPTNPTRSGYVFVGWFYEEDDVEKPFSFEMGITKNYDLYPKWSNQVNVTYTIQYIDRKTDKEIADSYTASARMGSTVTVKSKAVAGYFPELTSTSVQITEENQVIKLYYQSGTELTYTVKYVETVNGVDQDIAPSKTQTTPSIQVVEFAKNVEGYTPDYYQKTLELTASGENVVTFYYTKQVTINYVALEGGKVDLGTETLSRTTGKARGSTPTPKDGYKFVGWYTDKACKQPVDPDWVTTDTNKLTPQQVNGLYEEATYYAKFELDVFDLTITKAGDKIDPNQIFVFHVVSGDGTTDMEVTVKGIGSVKIKGLPLGTTYTVTEDTNWTWQYKPEKETQKVEINGKTAEVTFTNTYSKSNWLTSFAEVINKWITKGDKATITPEKIWPKN